MNKKSKTGLFFGSFNPVHVGHLIIANHIATHGDVNEVWLVVSPQNPHKQKSSLANDYKRLDMVNVAVEGNAKLKGSNIEFSLPQPSYTVDTLAYLKEKFPQKEFVLIMGGDNLQTFHKWKNFEVILENHAIYVYKRPKATNGQFVGHPKVTIFDAPMMNISARYIRKQLKKQDVESIRYLVTAPVFDYLEQTNLYR